MSKSSKNSNEIAVVGIGCRFPGANNPIEFWKNLSEGTDAIKEVPADRFDINKFYSSEPGEPGKLITRFGGFIDRVGFFDSEFFGISEAEARKMDPQQRIGLEVSYEALEDAGIDPQQIKGSDTGVFLGMHGSDYEALLYSSSNETDAYTLTGASRNGASGRISYFFGLIGPSMVIDSDRSSSLVAVHLACQAIRQGDCATAIAGGTNLILSPNKSIPFSRAQMLSPDGRCKFGDESANGFVRSEGVGMVILKRLDQAIADGDRIYCTIKGGAVQHSGMASAHLMQPSEEGQIRLIQAALKNAEVKPSDILYVEAHGTGTPVGDKIEIEAIGKALGNGRPDACLVGSVKSNIGHCESAAGIAGLIKMALALNHGKIPATLHVKTPNPSIPFETLNVSLLSKSLKITSTNASDVNVGLSSLGLTGTNAHLVLGVAAQPSNPIDESKSSHHVLMLTAPDEEGLGKLSREYINFLRSKDEMASVADICSMAAFKRRQFDNRLALVASSKAEMADLLEQFSSGEGPAYVKLGVKQPVLPKTAFIFPGQGGQWLGMGRQLFKENIVFRAKIEECDQVIKSLVGWSLTEEIFLDKDKSNFREIDYIQPILTAFYIAISEVWKICGVKPDVIIGTSLGEVGAAYVSGRLSLQDAFKVVCFRTILMKQKRGQGSMLVTELPAAEAEVLIRKFSGKISIAVSNSPKSTVLSGDTKCIEEVLKELEQKQIFCKLVKVDVASHCSQMDSILGDLAKQLSDIQPLVGHTPMFSTVKGRFIDENELLGPDYWVNNLRNPVLFSQSVQALAKTGVGFWLEMSPHPVLLTAVRDCVDAVKTRAVVLPSLQRDGNEVKDLLMSFAELVANGFPVPMDNLVPHGAITSLPPRTWAEKFFWHTVEASDQNDSISSNMVSPSPAQSGAPKLGGRGKLKSDLLERPEFERQGHLRDFLVKQLGRYLSKDKLSLASDSSTFKELEVTSVIAVEIRNQINLALDQTNPAGLLFMYPTLPKLISFLLSTLVAPAKKNLGDILLDHAVINRDQLDEALKLQRADNSAEKIGSILVKLGYVTPPSLQRALLEQQSEPLAVVGMGCRFPGGIETPQDYWQFIMNQQDAITEVPKSRWDWEKYFDPNRGTMGKTYAKYGGFVKSVGEFDAEFFKLSPNEATLMDPQQRLALEVSWHALEDANIDPADLEGKKVGVFIGAMNTNDYAEMKRPREFVDDITAYDGTGNALSILAGRLSYFYGFQGPAITLDTACSSSLVAMHLACQSLRSGETSVALVGGVNVTLSPTSTIAFSQAGMLAPDGHCKTFDAAADGYVRSEGCGFVVLKKLSEAAKNGDRILAVINGSAVNQDGHSNGLTAPNGLAQEQVIKDALAASGITPESVSYVEAHGTGTSLGDPIEANALSAAYCQNRMGNLLVGSVKTNLGHMEAAAGIGGFIKTALLLHHKQIPPNLSLKNPSPHIDFERLKIQVPTKTVKWSSKEVPFTAGVSSFGFSGTNAHVILSEAPIKDLKQSAVGKPVELLTISARSKDSLHKLVGKYVEKLESVLDSDWRNIVFTANISRSHLEYRFAAAASSKDTMIAALKDFVSKKANNKVVATEVVTGNIPKIGFLFSGQGSQYVGMGRELYETQPTFKRALDECAATLAKYLEKPLLKVMFGEDGLGELLDQTRYTQPALFALEYSLYQLWKSWGVAPQVVMGHSVGELVAACVAGIFSLEDGLKLISKRAELMQNLSGRGGMAAVRSPESKVQEYIKSDNVSIAAVNGPTSVTIAGYEDELDQVLKGLEAAGIVYTKLVVSHAFHSSQMDGMLKAFEAVASEVKFSRPQIQLISNVTGKVADFEEISKPEYWSRHVRTAVRYNDGMMTMYEKGCRYFLEMGPGTTLVGMGRHCVKDENTKWLPSLRKGRSDWEQMLEAMSTLYTSGSNIDWKAFEKDYPERRKVSIPIYSFERKRYWIDVKESGSVLTFGKSLSNPYLGQMVEIASGDRRVIFQSQVQTTTPAGYMADHIVLGVVIVPAAAQVEMVFSSAMAVWGQCPIEIEEMTIERPFSIFEGEKKQAQLILSPDERGEDYRFEICTRTVSDGGEPEVKWVSHTHGRLRKLSETSRVQKSPDAKWVEKFKSNAVEAPGLEDLYQGVYKTGLQLGERFKGVDELYSHGNEVLAHCRIPEAIEAESELYQFHPVNLDSTFQPILLAYPMYSSTKLGEKGFLPLNFEKIVLHKKAPRRVWSHSTYLDGQAANSKTMKATILVYDENFEIVAEIIGLSMMEYSKDTLTRALKSPGATANSVYEIEWKKQPLTVEDSKSQGSWILFGKDSGIVAELKKEVNDRGGECRIVPCPDDKVDAKEYFAKIFSDSQSAAAKNIVFMPELDSSDQWLSEMRSAEEIEQQQRVMYGGALGLVQTILSTKLSAAPRIHFVTSGAQETGVGKEKLSLLSSTIWGLRKVLALECEEIMGALIDVDGLNNSEAKHIYNEINAYSNEDQVAFREGSRLVARLRTHKNTKPEHYFTISPSGSYLISGGLGGIGLEVGKWLANAGAKHIVLMGRSSPKTDVADTIAKIEAMGARVIVFKGDVSLEIDVRRCLQAIKSDGFTLRGVFHAAGVLQDGSVMQQSWEQFQNTFSAKGKGAWNLHKLTVGMELDAFVMFSSVTSLIGNRGQANYAAANGFLDSLAHYRRSKGLPAISINWGPWAEVGMAKESESSQKQLSEVGMGLISPKFGIEMLGVIVAEGPVQVGVIL